METATIEMRAPEQVRERLHELVKATRTVMVLSCGLGQAAGAGRAGIDGAPMTLVRTGDDTTMYVVASLDAERRVALERDRRVAVVVPCAECVLFKADAAVSRDQTLIDLLWNDSWRRWFRGPWDPAIAIVVLSPVEGSFWEGAARHAYVYRLPVPPPPPVQDNAPAPVMTT